MKTLRDVGAAQALRVRDQAGKRGGVEAAGLEILRVYAQGVTQGHVVRAAPLRAPALSPAPR